MLSKSNSRISSYVLHNGKGRPRVLSPASRRFSAQTSKRFPSITNRNALSRPTSSSWRGLSVVSQSTLRFASTVPAASGASAVQTTQVPASTSPELASITDSTIPLSDAWNKALDGLSDPSIAAIEPHIGYLKELGLNFGWGPTAFTEWLFEHVHIYSGLPWAGSIVLTAAVVRLAMLKLFINAADTSARLAHIQPLQAPIQARIKAAKENKDQAALMQAAGELRQTYALGGVSPVTMFLPMIFQGMLGYGSFRLLRNMADLPVPGLDTGGLLWFSDLTIADPLYILPALTSGVVWYTFKRGGEMGTTATANPAMLKFMQNGIPSVMFIFTIFLPSAVQLTFFTSSIFGFFQSFLLRTSSVRSWLGIQPLPAHYKPPGTVKETPVSPYKGTITKFEAPTAEMPEEKKTSFSSITGGLKALKDRAVADNRPKGSRLTKQQLRDAQAYEQRRKAQIEAEKVQKARKF